MTKLRSDGTEWGKMRPHNRSNKVKVYRGYTITSQTKGGWTIDALPDNGRYTRLDEAIKAINFHLGKEAND